MTPQEAIKILNSTVHLDCKVSEAQAELKARICAIDALEKQIPKKPNREGDGYDDRGNLIYDTWYCPCCNHDYEVDYERYDYCPNCGQTLDWSEEE